MSKTRSAKVIVGAVLFIAVLLLGSVFDVPLGWKTEYRQDGETWITENHLLRGYWYRRVFQDGRLLAEGPLTMGKRRIVAQWRTYDAAAPTLRSQEPPSADSARRLLSP